MQLSLDNVELVGTVVNHRALRGQKIIKEKGSYCAVFRRLERVLIGTIHDCTAFTAMK